MRHQQNKVFALAIGLALSAPLWPICACAAPANGAALTGVTPAQALAAMQRDAQAIQTIQQSWGQLQAAAAAYGQLQNFANATWAGQGPVVRTEWGGVELCHNTRWDNLTFPMITGGFNIAGDAEALVYALQIVTVDFQQQYGDYLTDVVAAQSPQASVLTQNLQVLKASSQNLGNLLTTTGNQINAAMGPNTSLHPLPISNWQAGIGDAPDLAAARYIPGPNTGAPIGWTVPPTSPLARLVDVCPTGTASIPTLKLQGPVLSVAHLTISEAPAMASQLQPLMGGSHWSLPTNALGDLAGLVNSGWYNQRISLVGSLGSDLAQIARIMAPIDQPLASYNQNVQQMLQETQNAQAQAQ